ncbi:MAG: PAS domain S-box protein [Nitrospirae bacterium]|nr:PAS domain S-box protein [Candidatus Manganitrophaceae bacterium]
MNNELQQRVFEQTEALAATNEALRREINERKRVEEKLRESEERFRQMAEGITEVFWMTNPDKSEILYVSPGYERIWGRSCQSVYQEPTTWIDAIHPDDRERVLRSAKSNQVCGCYDEEYRIIRPEGSIRWIRDRAFPVRDPSGQVYRVTGIAEDITGRKRSDAALKESEERLRMAIDASRMYTWDWNVQTGRVVRTGHHAAVYGVDFPASDSDYASFLRIVHPEDRERVAQAGDRIFQSEARYHFEFRIVRPDGDIRWLETEGLPYYDGMGKPIRVVGVTQDITERKRAEEALRTSEERFRSYFEFGLVGMAITSPAKGCIEVNHQLCMILGYERSELLQKRWTELTHPDDLEKDLAQFNRVLTGEIDGYSIDKRFIRKNGWVIHAIISVKCIRRPDQSVDYFLVLVQDITERKQAEARLVYQANLLTHVGDAIIATDDRFIVTAWNLAAEQIYGWSAEEILGRRISEPLQSEFTDAERSEALKTIAEKGYYHTEVVQSHRDGRRIYIQGYTIALRDEAGRITGYVSANRDITERKKAEEALRTAKEFSENLIQTANVMILSLDTEGKINIFNEAAEKITGYSRSELKGKNWFETLVPKARYPHVWDYFNRLIGGEMPKTFENPILTKWGEERYIIWQNNTVSVEGRVVTTISFGNDITERKRMEGALRKSDERFHLIARATNDAIWDWDLATNTLWWNDSFKSLFGYKAEEIEPGIESWSNRIHPEDKERVLSNIRADIDSSEQFWSDEYRFRRADGSYATIFDRGYVVHVENGKPARMIGAMIDITARKEAEDAVARYAKRLRGLSGQLLEAQETERRRIARELHDEIGQSLTAIKIQLRAVQRRRDERPSQLEETIGIVDQALSQVRSLSLDLHPPQLDELGLVATLRWHLDQQARGANLTPQFSADPLTRLHPDLEMACFRVAQEALTNVIRHAEAQQVSIELRQEGGNLHLTIKDDGKGFDVDAARDRALQGVSMGLVGM